MKKFFMVAVMAVAALTANAQVYVGGEVGFKSTKTGSADAQNTFNIAPEVGYNLDETSAVGIALGFGKTNKAAGDATTYSIKPYYRYTFAKCGAVSFFADGAFEFSSVKVGSADAVTGWGIGIQPGLAVNLGEKLSFVAHVGNFGYAEAGKSPAKVKTFGLGASGNDLSFGLYYNF